MEASLQELTLSLDMNCPICLEEMQQKQMISVLDSCSHKLCEECFKTMINFSNKCPLCLKIFNSCVFRKGKSNVTEFQLTEKELNLIQANRNSLVNGIYNL